MKIRVSCIKKTHEKWRGKRKKMLMRRANGGLL
jgi:hypothetical protein